MAFGRSPYTPAPAHPGSRRSDASNLATVGLLISGPNAFLVEKRQHGASAVRTCPAHGRQPASAYDTRGGPPGTWRDLGHSNCTQSRRLRGRQDTHRQRPESCQGFESPHCYALPGTRSGSGPPEHHRGSATKSAHARHHPVPTVLLRRKDEANTSSCLLHGGTMEVAPPSSL